MSNGEFFEAKKPQNHFFNRERVVLGAASIALVGALAGCASASEALPERNTPTESAYSIDTAPFYYQDVAAMKEFTDDPATLEELDELLEQPVAKWLIDSTPATITELQNVLTASESKGTLPMFVAYNIPDRDLGNYSAGGAETAEDYKAWIDSLSSVIDDRAAVVILEPDALAQVRDMDESAAEQRINLLADAVDTFSANENTALYLDVGNADWLSAEEAANLLKRVKDKTGTSIPGISLNVSNFISEEETRQYAKQVAQLYGQNLYVMIDNSRNGAPDAVNGWCNPEGQRLGEADPTFKPEDQFETAFIKTPGQSDGECEDGVSERPAGEFDGELLFHQIGQ